METLIPALFVEKTVLHPFIAKCKPMCPTHSEAKQWGNVRVWSIERFIAEPSKETGGSCLKKAQTPGRFSAEPFERQGEGGAWLVVVFSWCRILCSCSCPHKSGQGQVMILLFSVQVRGYSVYFKL